MDIFNISTPRDFYDQLVVPEIADFKVDNSSQRRAISALIFAYHLHEKVYSMKFDKSSSPMQPSDADNFEAVRGFVNGTKHIKMTVANSVQPGFSSDYSSDYECPLTIEVGGRQKGVDEVLDEMIGYWEAEKAKSVF